MQQLKFTVAGQTLTRTDSLRVVADSVGQYGTEFEFDGSWDGYVATAQYTKNGVTYDENIVDGVAEVPAEALVGSGQFHVHVVGNSPDGKRITVNDLLVPVEPSGWRPKSSISAGPVITVWHKVVAMLLLLRGGTAGQFLRKKSADNYDGEWTTLPIDVDAAYRTAAEVDAALDEKAATAHKHDNRYAPIVKSRNDLPAPSAGVAGFTFMWGGQQEGGSANQIHFTPGHFYRCSGGLNDDAIEYEYAYTADATVTAETTGTYYITLGAMGYTPVTLPENYTAGTTYYTRTHVPVYEWEEVSVTDLRSLEYTANKVTSMSSASTDAEYPSAKAVYTKISSLTGEDIAYDNEYTLNGYIDVLMYDILTNELPEKESISNKVTSLGEESTDKEYPSAKCVYSELEEVDTTISGISDTLSEKEDASNKVIAMSAASTDEQYPSAKAVYAGLTALTPGSTLGMQVVADREYDDDQVVPGEFTVSTTDGVCYLPDDAENAVVPVTLTGQLSGAVHTLPTRVTSTGKNLLSFWGRVAPSISTSLTAASAGGKARLLAYDIFPSFLRTGTHYADGCTITTKDNINNNITISVATALRGIGFKIPVLPNTMYTTFRPNISNYQVHFAYFQNDGTYISDSVTSTGTTKTITTPALCEIMVVILTASATGTYTVSNFQLVKGSTLPVFEPYIESTADVPELNNDGTTGDRYDATTGKLRLSDGTNKSYKPQSVKVFGGGSIRTDNIVHGQGVYSGGITISGYTIIGLRRAHKLDVNTGEQIDVTNSCTITGNTLTSTALSNGDVCFYDVIIDQTTTAKPSLTYSYSLSDILTTDLVVSVGTGGDFPTINAALAYLSNKYPAYKSGGISVTVLIKSGTVISEQIRLERIDLSHITITSEDAYVPVNHIGWTGITHDSRGNYPFFSAEYGARLPAIQTLFVCTNANNATNGYAVGYFCNRGSTGVIASPSATVATVITHSFTANGQAVNDTINIANGEELPIYGFCGFRDNIIANNNSEIVLRGAVASHAGRWGVLARHISRVSARSAYMVGCGADDVAEGAAAHANRSSMLDVRKATLYGSRMAVWAAHSSTINANEALAYNTIGASVALSSELSNVDCHEMVVNGTASGATVFKVLNGGSMLAKAATLSNLGAGATQYSQTANSPTSNGIIYA